MTHKMLMSAMAEMSLAIFSDPLFLRHDTGNGHPETSRRLEAILNKLEKQAYFSQIKKLEQRYATEQEIGLIHQQNHVANVEQVCKSGGGYLDGDTVVSQESFQAAKLAAGSGLLAADKIAQGEIDKACLLVRPPGHHSLVDRAMGFCLFNNIAICARYLQEKHGFERVAILDWDVHHGNGTEAMFYDDSSVLFISTHQYPFYPGTGAGEDIGQGPGEGFTLNIPMPAGADETLYRKSFENRIIPKLEDFAPDIILVSAGFDAHRDDPLASIQLTSDSYAYMTQVITKLAEKICAKKVISFLEGGYNLAALADSVEAHVAVMNA